GVIRAGKKSAQNGCTLPGTGSRFGRHASGATSGRALLSFALAGFLAIKLSQKASKAFGNVFVYLESWQGACKAHGSGRSDLLADLFLQNAGIIGVAGHHLRPLSTPKLPLYRMVPRYGKRHKHSPKIR